MAVTSASSPANPQLPGLQVQKRLLFEIVKVR